MRWSSALHRSVSSSGDTCVDYSARCCIWLAFVTGPGEEPSDVCRSRGGGASQRADQGADGEKCTSRVRERHLACKCLSRHTCPAWGQSGSSDRSCKFFNQWRIVGAFLVMCQIQHRSTIDVWSAIFRCAFRLTCSIVASQLSLCMPCTSIRF